MLRVGYRRLATHLVKQAGFIRKTAQAGSVTFIQRLGSALNLNIHFHMLFLSGVFTLQTLPVNEDRTCNEAGKVAGFSLHAGVAARADQRDKPERLCRYICRPAVSERRFSLTSNGNVRYELKTPCRDGTTQVILLGASCPPPFGRTAYDQIHSR